MGSISHDISTIVRSSAIWAVVALAVAAVPLARWLRAKWFAEATVGTVWAAIMSCGGIVALTLLRDGIPHGWAPGNLTRWGASTWDSFVRNPLASSQVLLNILLFVPAGFTLTLLFRRPLRVVIALTMGSLCIECLQAILGAGANDWGDVVTNSIGGGIGVGCAVALLRVGRSRPGQAAQQHRLRRWLPVIAGATTVVLAAAVLLVAVSSNQRDVEQVLRDRFQGTTLGDVRAWEQAGDIDARVFQVGDLRTDGQRVRELRREQRYPATLFGLRRCIFVIWTDDSVSFERVSGADCTRFIDSDWAVRSDG